MPGASVDFPTHLGSHPNYDAAIRKEILPYRDALLNKYGSIDKIPDVDLSKAIDLIESKSLDVLSNWQKISSKLN